LFCTLGEFDSHTGTTSVLPPPQAPTADASPGPLPMPPPPVPLPVDRNDESHVMPIWGKASVASQTLRMRSSVSLFTDLVATIGAFSLAISLRKIIGGWDFSFPDYGLLLIFVVALWSVVLTLFGCYEKQRRLRVSQIAYRVFRALVVSHLVLAVGIFYAKAHFLSRGVITIFFIANYVFIMLARLLIVRLLFAGQRRRAIVVGTGETARRLADVLAREESYEIVGFVRGPGKVKVVEQNILGDLADFTTLVAEHSPLDECVIALTHTDADAARPAVDACVDRGMTIRHVLSLPGCEGRRTVLEHVGGLGQLVAHPSAASLPGLFVKRAIDIAGSLVGLTLTTIVFPFVALLIKLTSRGPIFFKQKRVGLSGRHFTIHKFRTMVDGAHDMRPELAHLNEAKGPHFKIKKDPRVTRVGRLLRRTSIDEFPQFWSVLKGDMSLVGPRPLPVEEVQKHEGSHYRRLAMRPGITGVWQTTGRGSLSNFDDICGMDEEYIRNWSLWLDMKLLLATTPAVVSGKGAV